MQIENPIHILPLYGQILSREEKELVHAASIIAGGKALLEKLSSMLEAFPSKGQELHSLGAHLNESLDYLEQSQAQGQHVLVLAEGDPLYFGIGATLARHLGHEKLCIHAGISILQRLCALLALPWHEVVNISLHGRKDATHTLFSALMHGKPVCVLTDVHSTPAILAQLLMERGAHDCTLHILEKYASAEEKFSSLSLEDALHYEGGQPLTVLIVPSSTIGPYLGLPEEILLRDGGLITKAEVRAVALSLLALQKEHVVWDVGAGSGAVAFEAAALAKHVVALERNPSRLQDIKENRSRMGAFTVDAVLCNVPHGVNTTTLPVPQRIFVGGGLSHDKAESVLDALCAALDKGGRMVISAVLLGTLQAVQRYFQQKKWPVRVLQVHVSEGRALGMVNERQADMRFVPQNPVFLVSVEKPTV